VREFYPQVSLILAIFVTITIVMEFYRGARVIAQKAGVSLVSAAVTLTRRNTRRYGGYIVHFGMVLIFVGITGAAFNTEHEQEMNIGEQLQLGSYQFRLRDLQAADNPNYASQTAIVEVRRDGQTLDVLRPERRFYKASGQPTTEAAIRPRLSEDLYVVYAGMNDQNNRAVLTVYRKPLVNWIWAGGLIVIFGTLIALVPSRPGLTAARRVRAAPARAASVEPEAEQHEVPA
jgi:cytochrome c-type biogenesis protein CcmF